MNGPLPAELKFKENTDTTLLFLPHNNSAKNSNIL